MEYTRIKALSTSKDYNPIEKRAALRVVKHVGNQEVVELDWDDLTELTGFKPEMMEELLQLMVDTNILEFADFENSEIG